MILLSKSMIKEQSEATKNMEVVLKWWHIDEQEKNAVWKGSQYFILPKM